MLRRNIDLTKVRLFPEYPAEQVQAVWDNVVLRLLDEFPELSAAQRGATALRRFQERLAHPSR